MNTLDILDKIKDAIQREEELTTSMLLKDVEEYDSLGALTIISLYDELFNIRLNEKDFVGLETVNDLLNLIPRPTP